MVCDPGGCKSLCVFNNKMCIFFCFQDIILTTFLFSGEQNNNKWSLAFLNIAFQAERVSNQHYMEYYTLLSESGCIIMISCRTNGILKLRLSMSSENHLSLNCEGLSNCLMYFLLL